MTLTANNGILDAILSKHFPDFSTTAKELLKGNFLDEPEALLKYKDVKEYNWKGLCDRFNFNKNTCMDRACRYITNVLDKFVVYSTEKNVYVVED